MIVVASVTASWLARSDPQLILRWLTNAEAMADHEDVLFFAALEAHPAKREALEPLLDRLDDVDGRCWWYWLDDGQSEARSNLRTIRVTTGRNLAVEYALRLGASHVLFLDADITPPADAIPRLLEVDWPIVGGEVPAYCLSGPQLWAHPKTGRRFTFPVQEHWNTAGFLLVQTPVLQRVRWGHDPMLGLSDDPWFAQQVEGAGFGKTLVRKDCIGEHEPLGGLEGRGLDRRLDR